MTFTITVPGRPVPKKNSRQIVRSRFSKPRLLTSNAYKRWASDARVYIAQAKINQPLNYPLTGPLRIHVTVCYKTKRVADLSNCLEGIQDELQLMNVIENDRQIVEIKAGRIFGANDYLELKIERIDS